SRIEQRIRPLKASTIRTRKAELMAAARMAVRCGVPVDSLPSLAALLHPAIAEQILDGYWEKDGEEPKTFTIDLSCRFAAIARELRLPDDNLYARLDAMRQRLEEHRQNGLTDKNIAFIRQVLTPGIWPRVLKAPESMMARARQLQSSSPNRAAVEAQIAVA